MSKDNPSLTRRTALRLAAASPLAGLGGAARASDVQAAAAPAAGVSHAGIAVPIGGALKFSNTEVWARLVQLTGGAGSGWVVLPTAAGRPQRVAVGIANALMREGAQVEVLPVAPSWPDVDLAQAVRDPRIVEEVRNAQGVFFSGGAQERITSTLAPDGGSTPLLDAIRELQLRGGVVAGTSAGAAVMSSTMIRDAQDNLRVLKAGARMGREIDHGLGFIGHELFIDQHFLKRGRIGRIIPVMWQQGLRLGLGIDENTAAIIEGSEIEIIGGKGALLVDLTHARHDPSLPAFNLRGARLSYLDRGDRHDLATGVTTPSPQKLTEPVIDASRADFKPYHQRAPFYTDMLGDSTIVNAMGNLIDNRDSELYGLAFDGRALRQAASEADAALGFEFRLYRGPDSRGWYTGAFGGEDYTVVNLYLDITPVRMGRPFYRPLTST
ncbi:cyanophycinase [Caldimonas sp. KR1-144]|uniref:cyanophycinase n=1 Tax=Caldimonas sp. KR1-144 TaxID=3400911 RepID=UPI003C0D2E01